MKRDYVLPFFIVTLILITAMVAPFRMIPLRELRMEDFTRIIMVLFLLSIFLERGLEVFITTWRGGQSLQNQRLIRRYDRRIAQLEKMENRCPGSHFDELQQIESLREKAIQEQIGYKYRTQRIALWSGFIFGIAISAVGFRALESILDTSTFCQQSTIQCMTLRLVDVMLTGCLIAGGSEGLHKVMQAFTTFMDQTAEKSRAKN